MNDNPSRELPKLPEPSRKQFQEKYKLEVSAFGLEPSFAFGAPTKKPSSANWLCSLIVDSTSGAWVTDFFLSMSKLRDRWFLWLANEDDGVLDPPEQEMIVAHCLARELDPITAAPILLREYLEAEKCDLGTDAPSRIESSSGNILSEQAIKAIVDSVWSTEPPAKEHCIVEGLKARSPEYMRWKYADMAMTLRCFEDELKSDD